MALDDRVWVMHRWVDDATAPGGKKGQYVVAYDRPRARRSREVAVFDIPAGSDGADESLAASYFRKGFIAALREAGVR